MRLVQIKTQEDRLEAQKLKNLNRYVSLIELLDAQAQKKDQQELQTKTRVKRFYIISGVIIGVFVLGILGTFLSVGVFQVLSGKYMEKQASKPKEVVVMLDYKGDDSRYADSAARLTDNDGKRLDELVKRFDSSTMTFDGYSRELKDLWLVYTTDEEKELRNRFIAIYEFKGAEDGEVLYYVTHMDNIKYADDTSLELGLAEISSYRGEKGYGFYKEYKQARLMEVDHFGSHYEVSALIGGDET